MIGRWWLWLVLPAMAANAAAEHSRVLVDGARIAQLPVLSRFLLPDGSLLSYQDLVLACSDLQASGVLYYRPDTSSCRPAWLLSPPDLPDHIDLTEGIQVFNSLTRETCKPGQCQVVIQGTTLAPGGGGGGGSPINNAPVADAGTATTDEDTPVTITLTGSDADGDALTFDIATPPANGSLGAIIPINSTTAEVTYTPDPDFNGADGFTFTVNDGTVDSAAASVDITVNAVNDAPAADAATATTDQDTAVTITLTGNDVDGDALTFNVATPPTSGSLGAITTIDDTTAEVVYTPNTGFNGSDGFTFIVHDGTVGSSAVSVDITVNMTTTPINNAPVADAGTATADEDTTVTITLTGSDADGDALTFDIATPPANGSLGAIIPINSTTGEVTYSPDPDFNGADGFTFTVNDGTVDSAAASVDVTLNAVNDPPTFAGGGDVTGLEDTSFSRPWASSITPGPGDESGQTVMLLVTGNANPGLFVAGPAIDAAGRLTFTPAADATGSAVIEVVAMDDGGTANGGDDLSPPVAFTINVIAAADLVIDKTSGSFFTPAGGNVSYTIVVSNPGPSDVMQAKVIDMPPPRLGNVAWTCTPSGPADCNPSGTTQIDELVNLPEGTRVTFELQASLLDGNEDAITNVAEVRTPTGVLELAPASNVDADTDLVGLFADGMESVEPD